MLDFAVKVRGKILFKRKHIWTGAQLYGAFMNYVQRDTHDSGGNVVDVRVVTTTGRGT